MHHPLKKDFSSTEQQLSPLEGSRVPLFFSIINIKDLKLSDISILFLALSAASLAFLFKISTFLLMFFTLFTLWNAFKNHHLIPLKRIILAAPFLLYFLLYAISFSYSSDKVTSFHDLETKFSFLALPLLILFYNKIDSKNLRFVLLAFLCGLLSLEIISLMQAVASYLVEPTYEHFFYHQLVSLSDANASYFSWYVLFSIIILLFYKLHLPFKLLVAILLFQILYLYLLSSRSMQLVFLLLVAPYAMHCHFSKKSKLMYKSIAAAYMLLLAFVFLTPQNINQRFNEFDKEQLKQAFLAKYHHHSYEFNSWNTRLFFWRVGVDNIQKSNLLVGVGNGDVNKVQNRRMHELGILNMYDKEQPSDFVNMNLHNMYLQSQLAVGILGSLLLLAILIFPLMIALKNSNRTFFLFQMVSILFMIQESAFQTQAGVVFYCFFSLLFLNHSTLNSAR